jgi:RND superfamily putative drug exporter
MALNSAAGGAFRTEFKLPGSASQAAFDLLERKGFADRAGAGGQIVFESAAGVDDPAVRQAMEALFARVDQAAEGVQVVSPYGERGARQISSDRRMAYAEVNLAGD